MVQCSCNTLFVKASMGRTEEHSWRGVTGLQACNECYAHKLRVKRFITTQVVGLHPYSLNMFYYRASALIVSPVEHDVQ